MGTMKFFDKKLLLKDKTNSFDKTSSDALCIDLKKSIKVLSHKQLKENRNPLYTYLI